MQSSRRIPHSILVGLFLSTLTVALLAPSVLADGTRTWEQSKFDDLTKGTATGVAIRSSGGLELGSIVQAALRDAIDLHLGRRLRMMRATSTPPQDLPRAYTALPPDGQATIIFEPQELQVQTLEVAPGGVIYAATAPDGKVYKIEHQAEEKGEPKPDKAENKSDSRSDSRSDKDAPKDSAKPALDPSWTSSEYFAPGTKYIWDLVLDKAGNLYVATGDHGEIYKVTPKGEHSLFFKSDDTHIRVLALDAQGERDCGHRRQRPGLPHLSRGRRIRSVQRAQERNHRARSRSRRQHLCGRRGRKARERGNRRRAALPCTHHGSESGVARISNSGDDSRP